MTRAKRADVEFIISQQAIGPLKSILEEPASLAGPSNSRKSLYTGMELGPDSLSLFFSSSTPVELGASALAAIPEACWNFVGVKISLDSDTLDVALRDILDAAVAEKFSAISQARKPKGRRIHVNDCFAIPLSDGRFGHSQYLHSDKENGDYVQVFDVIDHHANQAETLRDAAPLFPIIMTLVKICVEVGGWAYVGNVQPRETFRYPQFRTAISAVFHQHGGELCDWYINEGPRIWEDSKPIGKLPPELRCLEYHCYWSPTEISRRILTGHNPFAKYL